jgi:hypothetical protein
MVPLRVRFLVSRFIGEVRRFGITPIVYRDGADTPERLFAMELRRKKNHYAAGRFTKMLESGTISNNSSITPPILMQECVTDVLMELRVDMKQGVYEADGEIVAFCQAHPSEVIAVISRDNDFLVSKDVPYATTSLVRYTDDDIELHVLRAEDTAQSLQLAVPWLPLFGVLTSGDHFDLDKLVPFYEQRCGYHYNGEGHEQKKSSPPRKWLEAVARCLRKLEEDTPEMQPPHPHVVLHHVDMFDKWAEFLFPSDDLGSRSQNMNLVLEATRYFEAHGVSSVKVYPLYAGVSPSLSLLSAHKDCLIPRYILNTLVNATWYLYRYPSDPQYRSLHTRSRFIRQIIYGIILAENMRDNVAVVRKGKDKDAGVFVSETMSSGALFTVTPSFFYEAQSADGLCAMRSCRVPSFEDLWVRFDRGSRRYFFLESLACRDASMMRAPLSHFLIFVSIRLILRDQQEKGGESLILQDYHLKALIFMICVRVNVNVPSGLKVPACPTLADVTASTYYQIFFSNVSFLNQVCNFPFPPCYAWEAYDGRVFHFLCRHFQSGGTRAVAASAFYPSNDAQQIELLEKVTQTAALVTEWTRRKED